MFEHADWQEFDRGGLSYEAAITHFAKTTGRSTDETRTLIHATRESLRPIVDSVRLVEHLAAAGVHLYLLSNMPVSTFEYLIQKHRFFDHFKHLVISGAILMVKPELAIYKHLVEATGILPAESVFIDDLLKNVIAARECGFHAIQFSDPASCREQLGAYLPGIV
jgi:putative hydrolase of the HAD superfamily